MSWAFDHLNHLSPLDTSPVNGPGDDTDRNDFSLSYPINGSALHAQLEAWTSSVAFDFDGADSFGTPLGGGTADEMREKDDRARQHYLGAGLYGGLGSDGSYASLLADPAMGFGATPFDTIYQGPIPAQGLLPPLPAFPSSTATDLFVGENKKRSAGEMEAPAGVPGVVLGGDEEANALAIEEDKRKRNTAASARFRVKKKQREAALESTAKELRDKVSSLEHQVEALRTENGWLRGIITEKAQKEEGEKAAAAVAKAQGAKRGSKAVKPEEAVVV